MKFTISAIKFLKIFFKKRCFQPDTMYHQQPKTSDCIRVFKWNQKKPEYLERGYAVGDTGRSRVIKDSNVPYRFFLMYPLEPHKLKYDTPHGGYNMSGQTHLNSQYFKQILVIPSCF
jgi:hypothetical protein